MNWIHRPHAVVLVALSLMALGIERSMWASDPEAEPPVTAAAEGDPIVSIGKNMSTLASRLSESSANADPQREQLQQQIVNQLDALLKELEKESQGKPSSGNASGGGGSQQDTRTQIGEGTPQRKNPQNSGQGEPKEGDSRQSSQRLGKSAPKVNLAELLQVVKQVWGHLPEKERERLRQLSGDQVLPGHDLAIERYFRSLADEPQREDGKP
ncbi:MAG: hypothetical protein VYA11_04385 [Planctomycetota bacterium]|nr:hypothetical protein [Planctomycetota bacterium]